MNESDKLSRWALLAYMTYFAACSSSLLVVNKVAIESVQAPAFLMFCQMATSSFVARMGGALGIVEVDALELEKVQRFMLVVLGFLACVFSNVKVLQHSNVETFITFRSSTPLVMSFCDYWFLGRELPSMRSWTCLLVVLAGAVGYVCADTNFKINAYSWLAIWYVFFIFDTTYIKYVCDTVRMTNWGRVYYTNLLTLPFLVLLIVIGREVPLLLSTQWNIQVLLPLVLSCIIGVCMSHSAYLLRSNCSGTTFTVVGIVCKFLSVFMNWMIWDKHASKEGLACLLLCILAATFYQQAPMREPTMSLKVVDQETPLLDAPNTNAQKEG